MFQNRIRKRSWLNGMNTMNPEKQQALQLLGMARKSGNMSLGNDQTMEQIKTGTAVLVLVAQNAGMRTQKKFQDKCQYYQIPIVFWGNKDELSQAVGKSKLSVLGITDKGFADKIKSLLLS